MMMRYAKQGTMGIIMKKPDKGMRMRIKTI
jgi:hypothetical protein